MATTATPSKLTTAERTLLTQSLSYYYKGTQRAVTMATDGEIKDFHTRKAQAIANLNNKLSNNELDL